MVGRGGADRATWWSRTRPGGSPRRGPGPQVAWKMARGGEGSFGGKTLLKPYVWLAFCLVFLLGLADLRRPLSMRNLDLLVLLGFTVSLAFFDRGEIFRSVPLVYPVLAYLLGRGLWVGFGRRGPPLASVWPTWVLAAAAVFLLGFRIGLNLETPRGVIDVGLAGVVGASRILDGEAPYGNMPQRGDLEPCGPKDAEGQVRERIQTNGRCEAAIERGDTYGPVSYLAYVPATLDLRMEREVGLAACGARHVDRVRPARDPRARPRRAPVRRGPAGRVARLRLDRVPVHRVHAEREHERRDHARLPPPRLLARDVGLGARRQRSRLRAGRSSARSSSRRCGPRIPCSSCAACSASPPRSSWRPSPRSRSSCSSPRSGTRCGRSGSGRSGSRPGVTHRSRSGAGASTTREGIPDLGFLQPVVAVLAVVLALVVARRPEAQGPGRARGAHGRGARRLPAHADPLVLPLPPVGRPVRAALAAAPAAGRSGDGDPDGLDRRTPCPSRSRTRRARPRSCTPP